MFIKHYISIEQISVLESVFAVLTPTGWVVPAWLEALRVHQ
jgi:hypothetical protein